MYRFRVIVNENTLKFLKILAQLGRKVVTTKLWRIPHIEEGVQVSDVDDAEEHDIEKNPHREAAQEEYLDVTAQLVIGNVVLLVEIQSHEGENLRLHHVETEKYPAKEKWMPEMDTSAVQKTKCEA